MTEAKLREIVAFGQWGVSFVVVLALMAILLGLRVTDPIAAVAGWLVATLGSFFLVLGMALCFRLPDSRKWIALLVEVFILACGVLYLHHQSQVNNGSVLSVQLKEVRQSAAYRTIQLKLEAANTALANLSSRSFPAEYLTAFRENEVAKATASANIDQYVRNLQIMEEASTSGSVTTTNAFDIFGASSAWWVEAVVLMILAIGNEAVALALMYRPKAHSSPQPHRTSSNFGTSATQGEQSVRTADLLRTTCAQSVESSTDLVAYIEAYRTLKGQGRPTGYRTMMEQLGWSEPKTREIGRYLRATMNPST